MVEGALGPAKGSATRSFMRPTSFSPGYAVAVAFHCGLFNIGGEGQAYVGGLGVAWACLCARPASCPWWYNLPRRHRAPSWSAPSGHSFPAWLQAKRGSHVVITTIMFNFIAAAPDGLSAGRMLKPAGSNGARNPHASPKAAKLPFAWIGHDRDVRLHDPLGALQHHLPARPARVVSRLAADLAHQLGYEIRTMGFNPTAASLCRYSPIRIIVITMMISAALAGMMALNR
jgi:ABC-type uncharacterized transport system permease subunit